MASFGEDTPSLKAWAEAEGLEEWSQSELQVLYGERFGTADPREQRRQARDARLVEKRLAPVARPRGGRR